MPVLHASRALALTAVAVLLSGCATKGGGQASDHLPVVTVTTAAASPTAPTTVPTSVPRSVPTAAATKSASSSPAARATTVRPVASATTAHPVATTSRPTPVRTTAKPVVTTQPPTPATKELSISGFAFSPSTFTIPVGTTVHVTNHDNTTHTWTSTSGVWDSGNLTLNKGYSFRFATKGTFDFICKPHRSFMTGRVTVS